MIPFKYKLCASPIVRMDTITDLGVFLDLKLYFHQNVDYISSQALKLLGRVHSITFSFSTPDSLLMLYAT
jgi:hypothetical protein